MYRHGTIRERVCERCSYGISAVWGGRCAATKVLSVCTHVYFKTANWVFTGGPRDCGFWGHIVIPSDPYIATSITIHTLYSASLHFISHRKPNLASSGVPLTHDFACAFCGPLQSFHAPCLAKNHSNSIKRGDLSYVVIIFVRDCCRPLLSREGKPLICYIIDLHTIPLNLYFLLKGLSSA